MKRDTQSVLSKPMLVAAFLLAGNVLAQEAKVTPLLSKHLTEFPGKEGVMITVVYPPGASSPFHRHKDEKE
jgi:quercetin dioxygenase-like cupin family protein